jgi:hypothetical protein
MGKTLNIYNILVGNLYLEKSPRISKYRSENNIEMDHSHENVN